jgi:hypothetical protein
VKKEEVKFWQKERRQTDGKRKEGRMTAKERKVN